MYYSLFEIFAIGIGPSSSHTVGPMKAAKRFIDNLVEQGKLTKVVSLKVYLYGSLALTGVGHGTLEAVVYGLQGLTAEDVDPHKDYIGELKNTGKLTLGGMREISFSLNDNFILEKKIFLPEHSNGMKFTAIGKEGKIIAEETYFSVGGGTIARQDEIMNRIDREDYKVPFRFNSCRELMKLCDNNKL